MTAGEFELVANVLPEPMLLVTPGGKIVMANRAMRAILGTHFIPNQRVHLSEIFKTPVDQIKKYLNLCSAARQFVPGSLALPPESGGERNFNCEGAALNGVESLGKLIILRLGEKAASPEAIHRAKRPVELLNGEDAKY